MRDDLLDAKAAIDWAVAQLPVLDKRIRDWLKTSPYARIEKLDIDGPRYCLLVGEREPLPRVIRAEAGAIINSLRSSLDMAAAVGARAMGIKPDINTHFPFFDSEAHFLDAERGLNSPKYKRWLCADDRSVVESVKPYEGSGGNNRLCAVHKLDIIRKHDRFIQAYPTWRSAGVMGMFGRLAGNRESMTVLEKPIRRNGETIVAYIPDHMAEGKPHTSFGVLFNEPEFLRREPVIPALEHLAIACEDVLVRFK